jgi:cation:H+ antiporter
VVVAKHALRGKQSMGNSPAEVEQETASDSPNLLVSLAMLLIATFTLWVGSDSLVYGSKNLAYLAGVPEELIGFTLIALGTSLPELAASIGLVRKQHTSMLLGNIVGSNLFNIALIGGIAGILGPVRCGTPRPWVDYLFLLGITFLLVHWLRGKDLGKKHGILLLSLYLGACSTTWLLNS